MRLKSLELFLFTWPIAKLIITQFIFYHKRFTLIEPCCKIKLPAKLWAMVARSCNRHSKFPVACATYICETEHYYTYNSHKGWATMTRRTERTSKTLLQFKFSYQASCESRWLAGWRESFKYVIPKKLNCGHFLLEQVVPFTNLSLPAAKWMWIEFSWGLIAWTISFHTISHSLLNACPKLY